MGWSNITALRLENSAKEIGSLPLTNWHLKIFELTGKTMTSENKRVLSSNERNNCEDLCDLINLKTGTRFEPDNVHPGIDRGRQLRNIYYDGVCDGH